MKQEEFQSKFAKIIGDDMPPHSIQYDRDGKVAGFSYESEWKEGTTEPVENEAGETVYKENYKQRKLTSAQCEKLDELCKTINK